MGVIETLVLTLVAIVLVLFSLFIAAAITRMLGPLLLIPAIILFFTGHVVAGLIMLVLGVIGVAGFVYTVFFERNDGNLTPKQARQLRRQQQRSFYHL